MSNLIVAAVRGENLHRRPRWPAPAQTDSTYGRLVDYALAPERAFDLQFQRWLE